MKAGHSALHAILRASCSSDPIVVVDLGARGGLQPRWRPIADQVTWIGFEPDVRSVAALDPGAVPSRSRVLQTALSDVRGRVTLHRTRDEGDSSLLRPNRSFLDQFSRPERFDVVDTVELEADTLDSQLAAAGIAGVDVVKLDTQGAELAILRGAEQTLARGVLAVDVEVEFAPLYVDQPLFGDVDAYLRRFDLQLVDLAPRRWPYAAGAALHLARGPVVWAEAVYLPTLDRLAAGVGAQIEERRAIHLARAVLVALLYGFPDYAMALVERTARHVRDEDARTVREAVEAWDNESAVPPLPVTIEVTPDQLRALRARQQESGMKPTQQLRKALRQWLKSPGSKR